VVDAAPALRLGEPIAPFEGVLGTDGRRYGLADFADKDVLVFIFDANRCPTAKAYVPRMKRLQDDYLDRRVQLIAVNSTNAHLYADESFDAMVERANESRFNFPYLKDADQRLARSFGATCTFHVFVVDRERRLRYTGRFDDSRNPDRVRTHDLRAALEDILAGRAVSVPETLAFGCGLDFV
jgi:alkyl hydroperoxide reductase subunit AhpC